MGAKTGRICSTRFTTISLKQGRAFPLDARVISNEQQFAAVQERWEKTKWSGHRTDYAWLTQSASIGDVLEIPSSFFPEVLVARLPVDYLQTITGSVALNRSHLS